MPPKHISSPWIVASQNPHKAAELGQVAEQFGLSLKTATHPPFQPIIENGLTFIENALIKARAFSEAHPGEWVIADDSGICVDALNGAPGIYSARFAGENASHADCNTKLLSLLDGVPFEKRTAYFVCVLVALSRPDEPLPLMGTGIWKGTIMTHHQGQFGFGYDPIFWLAEYNCTSAELKPELKNQLSHRAQAMKALTTAIKNMA